ncbi:zinc finger matrin-type protein 1-like isoform X1 [Myxocyprinus asiaticus]|uniref:zinc finger matrin-type protein 1-like isoform X1 n=2 Tax=Myxocyprinus asiaticus TaxID=70543 RepID=UPI0022234635|nr:zinc finger matrin-type protein 1-like isoform X1 [Myxocyprinus asiaticus]
MSELDASLSCSPQCAETHRDKNTGDINLETVQITNTNNSQVDQESQRDSDLLKNLLTESYCHVCEATLLYESQRVSHYEGKKHAQKVRLYLQNKKAESNKQTRECGGFMRGLSADPDKFCELCNMVFSSHTVAKSHYEGKVHAKNLKRTNPPQIIVSTPTLESATPVTQPAEVAVSNRIDQEQDSPGVGDQEVDLSDPNKYCAMCNASFNNPVVAQQHYSGRKHQRNQTRQQMLDQIGDQSEHVSSLTCPICCLTLSSIEMYQAHMQGNKHQLKEKKVMELCKSQKKVYDSYQDELADYIQVQKARGLEPKAGLGTVGQASKDLDETINESPQTGETIPQLPPPRGFHQPHWPPQLQSQVNNFGFGMRGPVPHYQPGYMPQPLPHFMPGQLYKRGRSPDSHSSSSYSDSSSYASSSSSDSSSSRERRRRKRKMRKQGIKRRDQEDEFDTDRRGRDREEKKKRLKGDRRGSVEGEEDRETRRWKEKRKKERSQSEDEESQIKRRQSKRSRRHGDGQHAKRRKEAELMEKEGTEVQGKSEEPVEEKTEAKDVKQKHKKDKKKGKEKVNQEDNRTEEERLWDETILGIF